MPPAIPVCYLVPICLGAFAFGMLVVGLPKGEGETQRENHSVSIPTQRLRSIRKPMPWEPFAQSPTIK